MFCFYQEFKYFTLFSFKLQSAKQPANKLIMSGGSTDLVKDGEGAGCVAFEGELAVLSGCALGAGPLEQHAGHAVPVVDPDGVSLQCYVRGRLEK